MEDIKLLHGDCLEQMRTLPANSVDSIVSDPPYGISFMAKKWDYDVPSVEVWREAMRVLKPGGHALIACGTRTQHRMVVNIEDAGFEIRDVVSWIYGSGFPKSLNIGKAIDKLNGRMMDDRLELAKHIKEKRKQAGLSRDELNKLCQGSLLCEHWESESESFVRVPRPSHWAILKEKIKVSDSFLWLVDRIEAEREVVGQSEYASRASKSQPYQQGEQGAKDQRAITAPATEAAKQWEGWGTALKPACEFFTLARKPLSEKTVAANVLKWGTGGINVDGCRVGTDEIKSSGEVSRSWREAEGRDDRQEPNPTVSTGRFPANLIHDGSQEVMDLFPETKTNSTGTHNLGEYKNNNGGITGWRSKGSKYGGDQGSAARFFYCAKASKKDRGADNKHPTVKPTDLMRYLCRLITPAGGTVLDPYMGSGSTGKGARLEGFGFIGIELNAEYFEIASKRCDTGPEAQCT